MNTEAIREQLKEHQRQIDDMCQQLDETRETRNDLLRQRFDLKEQRRYFRKQLREAQNAENQDREVQIGARLEDIEEQLEELSRQIDDMETQIDEIEDDMEELRDAMADIEAQLEEMTRGPGAAQGSGYGPAAGSFTSLESAMDSINRGLQNVLGKVADTLEHVDLDNLGHNVKSAAAKAGRTVQDAAREAENAYHSIKDNYNKPGNVGDYRCSGSSVIDGGCYNRVSTSGACKVSSDLICRELKNSGTFHGCGNVDVSGEVKSSGAAAFDGNLTCGRFSGSGSTKIGGNLQSGMVTAPGALSVGGDLTATEVRATGSLKVGGDCEADGFNAAGVLTVGGMINADVVNIQLSKAKSTVCSIGGSQVTVTQTPVTGFLSNILMKPALGTLECESIEGDTLELTGVCAGIVRGSRVVIHGGCSIGRVEYSESCSIDEDAVVSACERI